MSAISTSERAGLRSAIHEVLDARNSETQLRQVVDTDDGFDRSLWLELAEMGALGLIVPEEFGGAGLGPLEVEEIAEEVGWSLLPSPFLSSSVLAASLISVAAPHEDKARLLSGIADGSVIAAAVLTGGRGTWTADAVEVTATDDALSGEARFVLYGHVADVFIVVAREADGFALFEVGFGAPGLTVTNEEVFDPTVRIASLSFANTPATPLGPVTWAEVQQALDLGVVALAGEQVGLARHIFDITIGYLKTRHQFGRPIGSFQAVKHIAADLLLELESATSAARHAADMLATMPEQAEGALALAGFACADAAVTIAREAIQLHGGIGFTWEYSAHLYLRRARTNHQLLGQSDAFRERYLVTKGG